MNYQQLTEGQRYQIALLYEDNFSLTEIGRRLGVNKSTISREVRRNRTSDGYEPDNAQSLCDARRAVSAKRSICHKTIDFVELTLEWKWSPEQISAIAQIVGLSVSHEWIYQYVCADKARGGELYTHLRQDKRRYRKGYGQKRSRIPDAVYIELRPAVVNECSRLGDWEADLVLGKQGTGAIVTLAERKSRIYLTKKVLSKGYGL
jgi:transposase, IS30 family